MIAEREDLEPDDGEVVFNTQGLSTKVGEQIVHDGLSFDIFRGDLLKIIGLNGQGKSLLISIMSAQSSVLGFVQSGKVFYKGQDVLGFDEPAMASFRREVGYVFQRGGLITMDLETGAPASALYNVMLPAIYPDNGQAVDYAAIEERARELLKFVDVRPCDVEKPVGQLSGGTQRRVATARAIMGDPEIVFYDEPVAGIDLPFTLQMTELIGELNREIVSGRKRTSVVVTNDETMLEGLEGRVGILHKGRFSVYDSLEECKTDIGNPAVENYFHTDSR